MIKAFRNLNFGTLFVSEASLNKGGGPRSGGGIGMTKLMMLQQHYSSIGVNPSVTPTACHLPSQGRHLDLIYLIYISIISISVLS